MARNKIYALNKNKYLTDPEFDRLNHILKSHEAKDSRNCLLLYLALHTGARAQELLNLEIDDIDEFEKSVLIRGLKSSNDRELPLPPWLYLQLAKQIERRKIEVQKLLLENESKKKHNLLAEDSETTIEKKWLNKRFERESSSLIFPISYHRLVQIWELYRPCHKKFHSLRHTFAIRLYKKSRDLRLVQVALGHRNIANTMIYADYVYSQQELRKLIL